LLISGAAVREAGRQLELLDALLAARARDTGRDRRGARSPGARGRRGPAACRLSVDRADCGSTRAHRRVAGPARRRDAARGEPALAVAVINDQPDAARLVLDAGADVGAFLPVHTHSTALHQAALTDDVALIDLLLAN